MTPRVYKRRRPHRALELRPTEPDEERRDLSERDIPVATHLAASSTSTTQPPLKARHEIMAPFRARTT